jgi:hypothetical protein
LAMAKQHSGGISLSSGLVCDGGSDVIPCADIDACQRNYPNE